MGIFKDDGCLSKLCKPIFCSPCPNPCHKPKPEESDPAIANNQEDPEQVNQPVIRDSPSAERIQDIEGGKANAEVLPLMPISSQKSSREKSEATPPSPPPR